MASYLRQRVRATKHAFSSVAAFKAALRADTSDGFTDDRPKGPLGFTWSNADLDPTPPPERTWTWVHFAALWLGYGFSVELWNIGSSMIAAGLHWYEAMICVFISHLLGAIGIVLNGRGGAVYHVGFPVYQRISFGMIGSFVPVVFRSAIGIIWVGVQIYQGGEFVALILRCIFGHHFSDIRNTIPLKAGITTQSMIGVVVFWVITLPWLFLATHKTRHFWTIKAVIMPFAVIGLFIFTQITKNNAGKAGALFAGQAYLGGGSKLAWTMLSMINATMGKTSTSTVNQPDLTRYSKTKISPLYSQLIMLPVANTLVALFGIFACSAIQQSWNVTIWTVWGLASAILDRHWSSATRFAIFLLSCAFAFSIFVTNQAVNVIPFGADMTALMPRYLTINRGEFISYCLGLVIQPWYILASATTFLTFLSGYSIFLGPILGITAGDYYYRRGNLHVPSLYSGAGKSVYWYAEGCNWRAGITYAVGVAFVIPGFVATFGYSMAEGWTHLYDIGWIFSTVVSWAMYVALMHFFPPNGVQEARSAKFEEWAEDQKDLLDRVGSHSSGTGSDSASLSGDDKKDAYTPGVDKEVTVPTHLV